MRLFPRTARRRLAAAARRGLAAGGSARSPSPWPTPTTSRTSRGRSSSRSSTPTTTSRTPATAHARRGPALDAAAAPSCAARAAELDRGRGRLDAARVARPARCRPSWTAAEARLEQAEADLGGGHGGLDDAARRGHRHCHRRSTRGRPAAAGVLLAAGGAETPADLTRQAESQRRHRRQRDPGLRRPARRRGAARGPGGARSRRPGTRSRCSAQAAAEHLVVMRGPHATQAARPRSAVARLVADAARRPAASARGARQHDRSELREAQEARRTRIKQLILRRRRAGGRSARRAATTAPTGGFLDRPGARLVTSPFGYRTHPIYGYCGLHDGTDFGAACGEPLYAAAGGTVIARYYSSVYGNRLYRRLGMVNGKNLTVVYNHAVRLPRRRRRARRARPGRRLRRHHRLVHRLPPALHGAGQRPAPSTR